MGGAGLFGPNVAVVEATFDEEVVPQTTIHTTRRGLHSCMIDFHVLNTFMRLYSVFSSLITMAKFQGAREEVLFK